MHLMNKKDSIYFQLLSLLVFSAVAAVFVFLAMRYAGGYAIEKYYDSSGYEERRNDSFIEKFQKYVEENQISSKDISSLDTWVKEQKILSIRIYKNGIQIFDSDYPGQELWEESIEANEFEWGTYYSVQFADGIARVSIFGVYAYQFYNYLDMVALLLSVGFFLIFFLMGIRQKMNYILRLSEEVEILEGGRLDYRITVKGKDELSALATGLEDMRLSFCRLLEENAKMVRENQRIITEMSHDLRTPVTSILLYTEIIKKGNYQDDEQLKEYIDKIDRKACRMKQLTNHLFEYSLVTGEGAVMLEKPEKMEHIFYDLFSETCSYLEQKGMQIKCDIEWENRELRVYTDYVMRILDNITSNLIKYADYQYPVVIRSLRDEDMVGFAFENHINSLDKKVESTCVGIQSVKSMMAKMGGRCGIVQTKEHFRTELYFPCEK